MRIIGGRWRGRRLAAPPGAGTRPTADRARQALFDRLLHAPWAERLDGTLVLDGFAGTGAVGLEALSRGAAWAVFMERDRAALAALQANVASCGAERMARVIAGDVLRPPPGQVCAMAFLDPPYGEGLVARAVAALAASGWIGADTLVVAEFGRGEATPEGALACWTHGMATMAAWRIGQAGS